MNVGIILAGGSGTRLKTSLPKQFMSLNGKPVYQYVAEAMKKSEAFDKVIMVFDKKYMSLVKDCKYIDAYVDGGANRTLSVYNALRYCKEQGNVKNVVFHDAARPFIKSGEFKMYISALKHYKAAITAQPITDALFHAPRDQYKLIQTPEAFDFKFLYKRFDEKANYIAIYEHVNPANIKFITLSHHNLKITVPEDFYIAEQLMKYQEVTHRTPNVKNKNILVLGGTGGIGSEITKQLRELGANVTAVGKEVDLSHPFAFNKKIYRQWDCIVHSAGAYATDNDGLRKNYDEIMNVNFRSIVNIVEDRQKLLTPKGNIVCIGSTAAAKGRPGISLYSASKAALNCFVEGISSVIGQEGYKINVICPAKVATKLQKKINPKAKFSDMISPQDIARIVLGYVDTDKTGEIVYVRVGEI